METAIKHPVPERVKPSFVIFDIWALCPVSVSVEVVSPLLLLSYGTLFHYTFANTPSDVDRLKTHLIK